MTRLFAIPVAALAITVAGCDRQHLIVGLEPPAESAAPDSGVSQVFPTSMGDPFPVDAPVVTWEDGIERITAAFDGQQHLVVWNSPRGLRGVRCDVAGTFIDREPLLIAPRALVTGGILVMRLPGGGFDVLWAGPALLGNVPVEGRGRLYAVRLGRDGHLTLPTSSEGYSLPSGFDVIPAGSVDWGSGRVYRLFRLLSGVPDGVHLATVGRLVEGDDTSLRYFSTPAPRIAIPGRVGPVALAHSGDSDYLATRVNTVGTQLELRVLPTQFGQTDTVVFRTSIEGTPATLRTQHFALTAVGDRVVLVWADHQVRPPTRVLRAVVVRRTHLGTFDVLPPVDLATSQRFGDGPVFATAAGTSLLVGIRGVVGPPDDPTAPIAIGFNPVTLAAEWSIDSGRVDGAYEVILRDFSWDGSGGVALVGGAYGAGYAFAQRVLPGQALTEVTPNKGIPGGENAQSAPLSACGSFGCALAWRDDRKNHWGDVLAARVSEETGLPQGQAVELFDGEFCKSPALAATGFGFVAACSQCRSRPDPSTRLVVRTTSPNGQWAEIQAVELPDRSCSLYTRVAVAADPRRVLIAALNPEQTGTSQLALVTVDGDGVAARRPFSLSLRATNHRHIEAILLGDRALLALETYGRVTTVLIDLSTNGADDVGLDYECLESGPLGCVNTEGHLVKIPGTTRAGFVWLTTTQVPDWTVSFVEFDARGLPLGRIRRLASGRGSARDLQVSSDETGLAFLLAERVYESEAYRLTFRHFSGGELESPPRARVVAEPVSGGAHSISSGGHGRWFTTYVRGGAMGRLYGRFVYEAPAKP